MNNQTHANVGTKLQQSKDTLVQDQAAIELAFGLARFPVQNNANAQALCTDFKELIFHILNQSGILPFGCRFL